MSFRSVTCVNGGGDDNDDNDDYEYNDDDNVMTMRIAIARMIVTAKTLMTTMGRVMTTTMIAMIFRQR